MFLTLHKIKHSKKAFSLLAFLFSLFSKNTKKIFFLLLGRPSALEMYIYGAANKNRIRLNFHGTISP